MKCGAAIEMATSVIETRTSLIEGVAIDEGSAVGDVGSMVVGHPSVVPVEPPIVPPPTKTGEEADTKARSEIKVWPVVKDSRNTNPTWIGH